MPVMFFGVAQRTKGKESKKSQGKIREYGWFHGHLTLSAGI